jgi:Skp family chaperone for outer membrane proteins
VSRGEQLVRKQNALSEKRAAFQREKERLQEELAAAEAELQEERVDREIRSKQLQRLLTF